MSPEPPAPRTEPDASAFDLLPDPVIVADKERRITVWNQAAQEAYGYTRDEALGQRPAELLATGFPMPLIEILEVLADTGSWRGNLVHHTKDGRELSVESHVVARHGSNGSGPAGHFAVDRDITPRLEREAELVEGEASAERERLHDRLHRAQRLESVGQLAGGIAHDFNNVLAIIINYAAFISTDLEQEHRRTGDERWAAMRSDLAEVQLAAERAARLTHQLLSFSRQDIHNPEPTSLNDAVRDVEELLHRTLGEHVELVSSLADDLQPIMADPGQLEQVLVNLAVNSRDAMPEGGTLTVDTANIVVDADYAASRPELHPGRYVRLRVSDTGIGMAPDVADRAFDPFFTTKPVGQGTGLGLATVFGIVRQADGRAQFYSEPGVGTTFVGLFPATDIALNDAHQAAVPATLSSSGETILLVEDEDAVREVASRILLQAGYDVLVADGGSVALDLARAHSGTIDLLLSDVVMPGMLGPHLATALRAERPAVPVLYMSGFAQPVLGQTMRLGVADLVEKPFTAPILLARVRTALATGG